MGDKSISGIDDLASRVRHRKCRIDRCTCQRKLLHLEPSYVELSLAIKLQNGERFPANSNRSAIIEFNNYLTHSDPLPCKKWHCFTIRLSGHPIEFHIRKTINCIIIADQKAPNGKSHSFTPRFSFVDHRNH